MSIQAKITNRTLLHDGFTKLENLTIEENGKTFNREFVSKKEAVVVAVINTDRDSIILTKQFRPVGEYLLECVAGTIDEGMTPTQTAINEVLEEVGYKITEENLQQTSINGYVSGGFTNEIYHCFIAEVTDSMKVSNGGGLDNENEFIEVVEMSIHDFVTDNTMIFDFKTNAMKSHIMSLITQSNIELLNAVIYHLNGNVDIDEVVRNMSLFNDVTPSESE